MKKYQSLLWCTLLSLLSSACQLPQSSTQYPPQSASAIRVCSQNLFRYSERNTKWTLSKQQRQEQYLLERMDSAKCDVVALQEVVGSNENEARAVALQLSNALSKRRGYPFRPIVAGSRDSFIRNAVLYREDLFEIVRSYDLSKKQLPRLQFSHGATGRFSRGPLLVHLRLRDAGGKSMRPDVLLAVLHFKSKRGSYRDGYGSSYEVLRMEMAEALREEVLGYQAKQSARIIPIILGDRNTAAEAAASRILEGSLTLREFRQKHCTLADNLTPDCDSGAIRTPLFVGLFGLRATREQAQRRGVGRGYGTHRYRGKESSLDEILLQSSDLNRVQHDGTTLRIGLEGQYFRGSDHKLLWAEIAL